MELTEKIADLIFLLTSNSKNNAGLAQMLRQYSGVISLRCQVKEIIHDSEKENEHETNILLTLLLQSSQENFVNLHIYKIEVHLPKHANLKSNF